MTRPHAAMIVDDAVNRRLSALLRRRGWGSQIVAHVGYGSTQSARVLARTVMARREGDEGSRAHLNPVERVLKDGQRRGWRSFVSVPSRGVPVTISLGGQTLGTRADRRGIIDVAVPDHGLAPGWHRAQITSPDADPVTAPVLVIGPDEEFGIVSDIDDTVIKTMLPRPMLAAWNTLVRHEGARRPVPGMATMYRTLLRDHPGAPVVYVSTGAWDTVPQLTRFLRNNGYPHGPLLLTDWGPTNTGWFRSGQEHKRLCLRRLAAELPNIRWVLVGDDGQHDPTLYSEFADSRPDLVRGIGIRVLTATEQMLSHFTPLPNDDGTPRSQVPVCRAGDGYGLLRLMQAALGTTPVPDDIVLGPAEPRPSAPGGGSARRSVHA